MTEYDVVVVLGAALETDGSPSVALNRRARHGVALVNSGAASSILFSGGAAVNGVSEAEAMLQIGLAMNLDPQQALVESDSGSTWENAQKSAVMIKAAGWSKVVLVSDEYHLPRARLAFKAAGIAVAVSSPRAFDVPVSTQVKNTFRESLGWVWYWFRGLV